MTTIEKGQELTYEIIKYKENIFDRNLKTTLGKKEGLLKELQKHFLPFKDQIIYMDVHVDRHHYVDEDEIWVEERHTLEISLDRITPELLAELERVMGSKWELRTNRHGVMLMKFDLVGGNLTIVDEDSSKMIEPHTKRGDI